MAERQIGTLLDGGSFFEGPRWHDGRWWVSDFYRHRVVAVDPGGREEHVMTVEGQPSGMGWLPDGSLLVVSMRDHRILRRAADGAVSEHADVSGLCTGYLNDMVVDRHGRAYAGNFGFDLMGGGDPSPAALIRVDPDGTAAVAAEDMLFPNGSVITPDGRALIVGETAGARYTAFTIEEDGSLSDRRVWAQVAPTPPITTLEETLGKLRFGPDGCAPRRRGAHLVGRRSRRALRACGARRRDRRRGRDARGAERVRLHARRRGRPHAAHVRGARLLRGGPQRGERGGPPHHHRRRAARRPAVIASWTPPATPGRTPMRS